jgi:hypothetical protein
MKQAALGFRVHSGWCALVGVSLEDGEPTVLCRKRVQLVETFNYDFRQPYHTAKKGPLEEGRQFISQVKSQAEKLAVHALREVQAELKPAGYGIAAGALLLASGRELPALENILASHALIHTADGELFREALADACAECRVRVCRVREKELLREAAQALRGTETALLKKVAKLGQALGSPWSQDEKFATLAAWVTLQQRPASSRTKYKATPA